MSCSLEVLAPTLSRFPLSVRPAHHKKADRNKSALSSNRREQIAWRDGLDSDPEEEHHETQASAAKGPEAAETKEDDERHRIWKAAQLFLGRPIDSSNVAHEVVPVRVKDSNTGKITRRKKVNTQDGPMLEVDFIVYGPDEEEERPFHVEDVFDEEDSGRDELSATKDTQQRDKSAASMVLVRMVNRIPLLDGSEAVACGLVQGLASKKRMWNSFGLEVSLNHDPFNTSKPFTFDVRDSDQVAPFFKRGSHAILQEEEDEVDEPEEESEEENGDHRGKRKRHAVRRNLLPASVRLGNILVIAQIHAEPTTLPLPTLSKVGTKTKSLLCILTSSHILFRRQQLNPLGTSSH
jgi:hypothetical protein